MRLFAYGTLMFPEIWRRVVGREFSTVPATLSGYAVYRVQGGAYPVMVEAAADARVRGLAYLDVDDAAWTLLDDYESTLYDRVSVEVVTDDERRLQCQAYVLPPARRAYAADKPWDALQFEQEALADYLRRLGDE